MDIESEVIHRQMDETRSSLQDKLETLEQQVKSTVQDATDAVESVKEAVQDTVDSVKESVQGTVDSVKDTVQGTVQSVKATFDISQHVQTYPWAMFFGATAVGFVATRWFSRERVPAALHAETEPRAIDQPQHHRGGHRGNGHAVHAVGPTQKSKSWLSKHYHDELGKIKALALGTLGGVVRELLTSSAPPSMVEQIKEVVDGITTKAGGRVIEGPILPTPEPERETRVKMDSFA